jgi:hypothetical protein
MGNSSSSRSDSRPAREKEIERDYEQQKKKISTVKSASVAQLQVALNALNTKNKELNECKWTVERLNAQIVTINKLNLSLNEQLMVNFQKYNTAVILFSGIVCVAVVVFIWLLVQRSDGAGVALTSEREYMYSNVPFPPLSEINSAGDILLSKVTTTSGEKDSVLLISYTTLFDTLYHQDICISDAACVTSTQQPFDKIWQILGSQRVSVSYSTLLSLVTGALAPSLSIGLVASCIGVLFATLAASFSILFFWSGWDGPTQLLTGLLYLLGFTGTGMYMHQTARDPALQIPGGTLVALGCCAMYLVVIAVFKTMHATSGTPQAVTQELKHRQYREDPMFRFVAVISVGVMAISCMKVIPFAPLGAVIVSSGGWFIIFFITLMCDKRAIEVGKELKSFWLTCCGVLLYSIVLWVMFNRHLGFVSVYAIFPKATNEVYPAVTDMTLWIEWSSCCWGLLSVLVAATGSIADKNISSRDRSLNVIGVGGIVYVVAMSSIFGGIRAKSLALSVAGHLGVLFFNVISLSVPIPLLAAAYGGQLFVSTMLQEQAMSLVGPIETLSSVVLGPIGVFMATLYTSAVSTGKDTSISKPFQALLMNIVLMIWGTYASRTLMFLVGLAGTAVFIIHVGMTHMKGSATFVLLLVFMSFSVAALGMLSQ